MKLTKYLNTGNARSVAIKKNIVGSLALKGISIFVSLQVVPLTINYVNPTQYGIWLTLSSIIAWLGYFDLGFSGGFRNKFAESLATGKEDLAQKYVSTTYTVLSALFMSIFIISIIIDYFLDWGNLLHVDAKYNGELQVVFGLLSCFFCMNIIASVFITMLQADQKPALVSLIQTGGQVLAFLVIYIMTKTIPGNLTNLALAFSGIPCILTVVVSICFFTHGKYRKYRPKIKSISFALTKDILGLGWQFFVIMISMLCIYQFINIVLSRIIGPLAVTQYNIAYKYFNIVNMIAVIVLTPFWSAFTDAYVKKDFIWMRNMVRKLEILLVLSIPILFIMILLSNWVFNWWIGSSVYIPIELSVSMAFFCFFQIAGSVYMYMINGTGKVRLQLVIYLFFAIIAIPIMNESCKLWGVVGVLIIPTIVYGFQAVLGRIQILKLINGKANGIFSK